MEYSPYMQGNPVTGNKADELALTHPTARRGRAGGVAEQWLDEARTRWRLGEQSPPRPFFPFFSRTRWRAVYHYIKKGTKPGERSLTKEPHKPTPKPRYQKQQMHPLQQ
jgi:hypothetical protein